MLRNVYLCLHAAVIVAGSRWHTSRIDPTTYALEKSLCRFEDTLEGTVLLPNHRCCDGNLQAAGSQCGSNGGNANMTFHNEDQVKLAECEDKIPSAIFEMRSTSDVSKAVKFLTEAGLPFTTRSGGHAMSCASTCRGCVVVSLLHMKSIEQVEDRKTKTQYFVAQPGVTIEETFSHYQQTDHMVLHGLMPTVALGGHYLGGGMGFYTRMYGFGSDYVVGVEMVLADGKIVTEFEPEHEKTLRGHQTWGEHKSLLWAARGSGHAGLGIVTKFWVKMIEKPKYVVSGTVKYSASTLDDMKVFWKSMCSHYGVPGEESDEESRLLVWPRIIPLQDFMTNSPVALRFDFRYVPANDHDEAASLAEGTAAIDGFLSRIESVPFSKEINAVVSDSIHKVLSDVPSESVEEGSCTSRNVMSKMDVCGNEAWLDDMAERLHKMVQPENWMAVGEHFYMVFEAWGGAAAKNDQHHRRSSMSTRNSWGTISYCRWPMSPAVHRDAALVEVDEFSKNVLAPISRAYYSNYADQRVENIRDIYPDQMIYQRLRILKKTYDHNNVFNSDGELPSLLAQQ
ncbi:6-hydroxy-D-nicotine oxidase [Diplonema papillatum]|nr:6-hydroxy-D-nicotine oxidase [Diplonema papillatum]